MILWPLPGWNKQRRQRSKVRFFPLHVYPRADWLIGLDTEHKAKFKGQAVEEEPELTKEERKAIRALWRKREIELAKIPNPYKPVADIYIRPATRNDIPQIT